MSFLRTGNSFFGGCPSAGLIASSHVTNVRVTNSDFKINPRSVFEEASSGAVFSKSWSANCFNTIALNPFNGKRTLQTAWKTYEISTKKMVL